MQHIIPYYIVEMCTVVCAMFHIVFVYMENVRLKIIILIQYCECGDRHASLYEVLNDLVLTKTAQ